MFTRHIWIVPLSLVLIISVVPLSAQSYEEQYQRPVDVAPSEETIGEGYKTPAVQRPLPRSFWMECLDIFLLLSAMALGAWIVLVKRNRRWLTFLTISCLAYFGFYREGCVCPIGAIQNITAGFVDPSFVVSISVLAFFMFPLILALFYGRVFCGGVCPLGAIQELVAVFPVQVPRKIDRILGSFKYIYLGLAVAYAALPVVSRDFLICRFDPFVGFFRGDGPAYMLMAGGILLILGMFVGRPFCRYFCPYGVLLSFASRVSWKGVTITPDKELDCGLCLEACPYGAIKDMRAVRSSCLFCARCYDACPRHLAVDKSIPLSTETAEQES